MKDRTDDQINADRFDLELYRLIRKAEEYGKPWDKISSRLQLVRAYVRGKMHPDDRLKTS